jgi:tetratricopeptide (TPR) repeat protein
VLGGLWMFEADFARMTALTGQSAAFLSHVRLGPSLVEVGRTAVVLVAISALILRHPAAARALVALRRLPAAAPDTPARATAHVLVTLSEARGELISALQLLCESDQPLLRAIANTVATFVWQSVNDPESALKAARRTVEAFDGHSQSLPWFQVVTHSRIGELCLELGLGDEAHEHFAATLTLLEELPELNVFQAGSSASRLRGAMVMANVQRNALDEAEYWLERTLREDGDEAAQLPMFGLVARAWIQLERGEVEAALRLWRQAADAVRDPRLRARAGEQYHVETWLLEVEAMALVAHAEQGRLDLVGQLAGRLPHTASRLIADLVNGSTMSYSDFPLCGTQLLALAVVDIDRGRRTGDARATRSGVRMIALAERFRFNGGMSTERLRRLAEQADKPAYAEAVSAYAGLSADALRAEASAAMHAREQFTELRPA